MIAKIRSWIESSLLTQDAPIFERVGTKHTIYKCSHHAPLASMFIDPPTLGVVPWCALNNSTLTESFFQRLAPVVRRHRAWWFFVIMPEDEYTRLCWVAEHDDRFWNSWRFLAFEQAGSEGGTQFLVLILGEQRGLIVFTLRHGLEIAYYGPDDLWEEISTALYGTSDAVQK